MFDAFATSTFFMLTLMCWLDMIGGVIFNIANSPQRGGGGGRRERRPPQDDYED